MSTMQSHGRNGCFCLRSTCRVLGGRSPGHVTCISPLSFSTNTLSRFCNLLRGFGHSGSWSTERLSNLLQLPQLVGRGTGIQNQLVWGPGTAFWDYSKGSQAQYHSATQDPQGILRSLQPRHSVFFDGTVSWPSSEEKKPRSQRGKKSSP